MLSILVSLLGRQRTDFYSGHSPTAPRSWISGQGCGIMSSWMAAPLRPPKQQGCPLTPGFPSAPAEPAGVVKEKVPIRGYGQEKCGEGQSKALALPTTGPGPASLPGRHFSCPVEGTGQRKGKHGEHKRWSWQCQAASGRAVGGPG